MAELLTMIGAQKKAKELASLKERVVTSDKPRPISPRPDQRQGTLPTADEFRTEIVSRLRKAERAGHSSHDIRAGDIHRHLGGYPDRSHRMATCCDVMYALMKPSDVVLKAPPKGKGASVTIRYKLPR